VSLISCTPVYNDANNGYTFLDDLGREVTISQNEKIAAAHASFADCWLLSGGELVGITSDAVDDHGLPQGNASIIGSAKTVNKEALIASGATAVLMSADLVAHIELEASLESIGIKCIYFKVDTFDDYARVMKHLTSITKRDDLYNTHVVSVGERINAILEKIPQNENRTLLLMRAYSSGIKAKSDDNLAGLILKEFGLHNIADDHPSLLEDMSLEHIVETDPNVILVLTMGNEEAAISYLRNNIENNKAFANLKAVKTGNYHILPKDLFHYKPNERWDESYEYLAKLLYGEKFD
jgi:iron complex transport system substrate-binding protein